MFLTEVYSRRIVGRDVTATLRAEILPMQALGMTAWDAGNDLTALTPQWTTGETTWRWPTRPNRGNRLRPSTGTVGDSFHDAMAEAADNRYQNELIRQRGPEQTVGRLELAAPEYVWWWTNARLHGQVDMCTAIEFEQA